jgi:hypothetical protein
MPFERKGKYYYSPSGKRYTRKQVIMYYATGGFNPRKIKSKRYKKKK